jgi:uncharacterized protein YndB with AHSA1/START domain
MLDASGDYVQTVVAESGKRRRVEGMERAVVLPYRPEAVWRAITRSDQLSSWFGAEVAIDARPGGRATFRWPDGGVRGAVVETIHAPRLLVLRWLPFAHDADGRTHQKIAGRIRFVLREVEAGTHLAVSESQAAEGIVSSGDRPLLMMGSR